MSELPRRFEVIAHEQHYYIVALDEEALFDCAFDRTSAGMVTMSIKFKSS